MAAFELANQMGADMIELDIQLSKDGVPVVFHDESLHKKSTGNGSVASLTVRELKKLDAGSWFSPDFPGEQIPLLEEVLDWAENRILLNIEIKPEAVAEQIKNGVEEKVLKMVQSKNMEGSVLLSSFHYLAVSRIKTMAPDLPAGLLYNKKFPGKQTPAELLEIYKADFFHCGRREIRKSWVDQLNRNGKPFLVYTVNRAAQMKKLIRWGAYGIFSDKPDLLKKTAGEESLPG
jgi:glycerophosphoryl diester phosphodiesterase